MAHPIKAIPTLYGEEARRFQEMADETERKYDVSPKRDIKKDPRYRAMRTILEIEHKIEHCRWFKNGLKVQKLLAQGSALGTLAISNAPCKGKSLKICCFSNFSPVFLAPLK